MAEARASNDDNGFSPMTGPVLWVAGFLLAISNFMVVLDTTIANVSVPNIAGGLAVSPSQGTWVITSYAVAEAIVVPLTGWLAQRFGAVRVFAFAMLSFGVCSFLCGLAPSLGLLVVFRVMQGLSGGPMMPLSQVLMRRIFPPAQQNLAMGLWSMTTVTAPIAGPLLGGYICDNAGWPWVFYINVPVAVLCAGLVWRLMAKHETGTRKVPVDFTGLALLIIWVGSMQIMLDKGKDLDWFASPFIVALAVVAVVGFIAFLIWELTDAHPVVDLRVFRHRGFAVGTLAMSLTFGAFFASVVLIPLWLQINLGYTASWAGRVTAWQGVLAVVMSPIVAKLIGKFDPRVLFSFGLLVLAMVTFWRTWFASNIDPHHIILPQIAQGFAMPFFFISVMSLALSAVPVQEMASASGLINFTRTTAAAFATSLTTTGWEDAAATHHSDLAGSLNGAQQTMDSMKASGLSADQARGALDQLVQGQSVMLATDHMFLICAMIFTFVAAVIWLAPRPKAMMGLPGH